MVEGYCERINRKNLCSDSNLVIPLTHQHEVRHPPLLCRIEQGTESVQSQSIDGQQILTIGLVCNGLWDIEEIERAECLWSLMG